MKSLRKLMLLSVLCAGLPAMSVYAQSPPSPLPKLPSTLQGKSTLPANPPVEPDGEIRLAQQIRLPASPGESTAQPEAPPQSSTPVTAPTMVTPPAASAPVQAAPAAPAAGTSSSTVSVTPPSPDAGVSPASATAPAGPVGTAFAPAAPVTPPPPAPALNAPDIGQFLAKSEQTTGVEVQRRNAIVSDPRLRGMRNGQFYSTSDGVPYFPARLDLDTPVSKFYPGMVRDVQVIRGPFTSLLGPALGFINIGTVDAPRAKDGCGIEYHGVSALGYQTNGEQFNALQVITAAGRNWGVRGSFNSLQGNDYKAGDGSLIPASYQSNNFNLAAGFDVTEDFTVDFKAMRIFQNNLEFPGLFFDIDTSNTEAYSTRFTARNAGPFDRLTTDLWYNATTSNGNTRGGAKQAFVNRLIKFAFEEPFLRKDANGNLVRPLTGLQGYEFQDQSTTQFAERSIGYRLNGQWGNNRDELTSFFGTDLNVFGQGLTENINFRQLAGPNIPNVNFTQQQSIPKSNSFDVGLFTESMVPVGEFWKLKTGGRMDYVRTSSNPRLITGNVDIFGNERFPSLNRQFVLDPSIYSVDPNRGRQLRADPRSQNGFTLEPNANIRDLDRDFFLLAGFATAEYKLSKEATVYLGYGYAERAPNLTELYANGPFIGVLQQGTSRLIGDPNLSKERVNQLDLGLRYDSEIVNFGISGFYSFIHDYITYDANRLSPVGLSQVIYSNTDLATLAGTELYLQVKATDWLTPFATLSYVQGIDTTHTDKRRDSIVTRVDANGTPFTSRLDSSRRRDASTGAFSTDTEPLPQIPPMETRLGFRVHEATASPKWQVEFATRIINGQNAVASSLGERVTPGFTTFDIRGYWQVRKNLLFSAGVENIGDKTYREHLDPIAANLLQSQTGSATRILLRPGTNFFFNTQWTY